ncbi:MoxR family ATPase [Granulosicoccaceae sp. 1_MG-2023]|nr:MoxR family ATPase [Granulosicoccaceae sp. 1_MG-2023]
MSEFAAIDQVRKALRQSVIGQERLVDRMLVALLADGHLLVEGAPGLAKTRAIRALAGLIEGDYQRIQFTPDLLPADITGTEIYRPEQGSFRFQQGPLFNNLILADEINRAPAKVQSALLEAMAERQVTVGHTTYPLPGLFMVMATQNPIEQEGTYPLPEAQLDRFMLHVKIDYPDLQHERDILRLVRGESAGESAPAVPPLSAESLFAARREVAALHVAGPVEDYIVRLIGASRGVNAGPDLQRWIAWGASPRGTIALDACARAHAWLGGRDFVSPDDVQAVLHDVLRHRVILSYEAEADAVGSDAVIDAMLARVAAP